MTIADLATRVALGASLAVSGFVHAYLYVDGYRDIPTVGPAFLLQGSAFCTLALLILAGGPAWLRWAAAAGAAASLIAFTLSRTVGLVGFTETGWQPTPYAMAAVLAEVVTVLIVGASVVTARRFDVRPTN
jgi:hypothetical protein